MEITEEEDTMMYIHFSKKKIDEHILKNEYQFAFNYLHIFSFKTRIILIKRSMNVNQPAC